MKKSMFISDPVTSQKKFSPCDFDGIQNECVGRHPKRFLVYLTHLFDHCLRLGHFPAPWKRQKSQLCRNPAKTQNLRLISLLSTTGKLFEKLILRTIQKHAEERTVLNASQFGFRADHSTTLQCMRLADHVTLNFNNNMATAAVF
jgi:hypothetical protein